MIVNAIDSPFVPPSPPWVAPLLFLDPFFKLGLMISGYWQYHSTMYSFVDGWCGHNYLEVDYVGLVILFVWFFVGFFFFEMSRLGWKATANFREKFCLRFCGRCCCGCCRKVVGPGMGIYEDDSDLIGTPLLENSIGKKKKGTKNLQMEEKLFM
jgi:hypothetical protein